MFRRNMYRESNLKISNKANLIKSKSQFLVIDMYGNMYYPVIGAEYRIMPIFMWLRSTQRSISPSNNKRMFDLRFLSASGT